MTPRTSPKPVRTGVVGFGYWGPNLVRNIHRLPDAELVALADASEANRAKFASLYRGIPAVEDVETLLCEHDVDAVVVATSAPSHHDIASRIIAEGKHCFVEKPLTLSSSDSADLVRMAGEARVVLMVGHLMEYHTAVEWIREYIASGQLGDALYLYAQRLNLGKVRTEENAFWSLAAHDVSVVLYLLGETPDRVSASGASFLTDGVADTVFANLHFSSGKMANIHVSWLDPHKVRRFTIVGTKKMLVFDDMEATEKVWIYDKGVGEPAGALAYGEDLTLRFGEITAPHIKLSEPLAMEMQHFLDCCSLGMTPRSDGLDGFRVVRVLEAVDESMAGGGTPVVIAAEV